MNALKIGVDYTSAIRQRAGIGRLTRNIIRELAEIDHTNQYTLLIQGRPSRSLSLNPHRLVPADAALEIDKPNFRPVYTRLGERWWTRIWHRFHLPLAVEWLVGDLDLFHSPDFALPPVRSGTRTIVTIHDLSFVHLPECFEPALLKYLNENVPRAVGRADWILADSENTRQDLIHLLHAPADRISVIYPGVEPRFCPISDRVALEHVRRKYNLPPKFILGLGTVQPRKNYARLIEAFSLADLSWMSLVVVGGRGWLYEDIFARVRDLGLEDRVLFTGFVDDDDLPVLYNLAHILAFPSLYEGFGIPLLESMACGTPVISADNSSLPEAVGDAGLLIDAYDTQALADALGQLEADSELRQTLIRRGRARAEIFTWQQAAQTLLATYMHVCSV